MERLLFMSIFPDSSWILYARHRQRSHFRFHFSLFAKMLPASLLCLLRRLAAS